MPRIDAAPDHALLVRVLREPEVLRSLTFAQCARVMDAAEYARLLGWFQFRVDEGLLPAAPPAWLTDRLTAARAFVDEYDRAVKWEIDRLHRAFLGTGIRWVLLKGAGYLAAGLPPGRGRNVADIDVLVPLSRLADAEAALHAHGWITPTLDPYDERYYREWMHELPPMVHEERGAVVDLHHAILPRTSRLRPSSDRLLERCVAVAPDVHVLCPSHMVLHAAAHLFHDGEIAGAIRDVVDLDGLLRCFATDPDFWSDFVEEAGRLGLTRPAYYAVRYARQLLDTPVPAEVMTAMAAWAPGPVTGAIMDRLVLGALPGPGGRGSSRAALALYVRSHWLRMPPLQVARHLARKATRSN